MNLKEFIKTAVSDITNTVSELQTELNNEAIICPSMPNQIANLTIKDPGDKDCNRQITKIDFDVAITVGSSDKIEGNAKAGIQIFSAKVGSNNEERNENVSRITFSIPVVLPTVYVETPQKSSERTKPKRPVYDDG